MSERTLYERVENVRGYKFIRLKSGRMLTFWDAIRASERARTGLSTAISRAFKLADGEYDLERLEWLVDNLESHVLALRRHLDNERGIHTQKERIALLRNTTGRTAEEAEMFQRKADDLEARLGSNKD
jgi:hypothetical protein